MPEGDCQMRSLVDEAGKYEDEIISIRRRIHQNPELSYREIETAKLVASRLRRLGIEVQEGVGGTGVVGLLRTARLGRVVGLRADMDALPIQEESGVEFESKVKGVMHACGHDTHVAMLLGAAMLLSDHRAELSETVKFIFQPAEEVPPKGGAMSMIEDGVMDNPKVDYIFGLHVGGDYPARTFATRAGPLLAKPDVFRIRVIGKSGHGSAPHQTVDPIYVGSQLVTALQSISSRMIDPLEPFVISVCRFNSGTAYNIIPNEAELQGTIRTLDEKTRSKAVRMLHRIVQSTCRAYGADSEVRLQEDTFPVTVNHPRTTDRVLDLLRTIEGTKVMEIKPILGGEDFSRFLERAPGVFYFIGTRNKGKGCVYPNHSSRFKVDEDVLKYGSASLATIALEFTKSK
jgi:carboxypeptidase Ss1